jgi:hypothetical protein
MGSMDYDEWGESAGENGEDGVRCKIGFKINTLTQAANPDLALSCLSLLLC